MDTTHLRTTLDTILYHKNWLNTTFHIKPWQSWVLWRQLHSATATHRNLLPNFTHLFLQGHHLPAVPEKTRLPSAWNEPHNIPKLNPQQVLRKPGSCQPELNPTMSQSQNPRGSWGTRLLSAWTEPHNVPKPKPQWVLRKPRSCQPELNPTMSQNWKPSGSWGDQTHVSLNWTPQCPNAEAPVDPEETKLLSAWTEPHNVSKLKA